MEYITKIETSQLKQSRLIINGGYIYVLNNRNIINQPM